MKGPVYQPGTANTVVATDERTCYRLLTTEQSYKPAAKPLQPDPW